MISVIGVSAALVGLGLGVSACGSSDSGSTSTTQATSTAAPGGTTGTEKTIKVGYVTTPQHPYGLALEKFAQQVADESAGKVGIQLLSTYAGGNDVQLLNDIRGGTIDAGSVSAAVWEGQGVDSFEALQMPFLITNYKVEGAVLNSDVATTMLKGPSSIGLKGLAIHEGGLRKPAGAEGCIVSAQDFDGTKMRSVESPLLSSSLRALGAQPTPMPLGEVYLALQQGTVDALEANLGLIYTQKFYEVIKCTAGNVNLWPFPTVLAMNQDAWDGLTTEQQGWIESAAAKLDDESLAILTDPTSTLVADLCDAGMKFGTATPAALAAMRGKVQSVYDEYKTKGQTGQLISQIDQIKAETPAPPAPKPYPSGCAAS